MEPFLVVKTCTTFFKNFIFCKSLAPLIENFFLFSKSRRNTRNHFRSQFFILVKELVNLEATSITHTHELFCEMSWPQLRSNSNWAHNKIGTPNCSWQSDSCYDLCSRECLKIVIESDLDLIMMVKTDTEIIRT